MVLVRHFRMPHRTYTVTIFELSVWTGGPRFLHPQAKHWAGWCKKPCWSSVSYDSYANMWFSMSFSKPLRNPLLSFLQVLQYIFLTFCFWLKLFELSPPTSTLSVLPTGHASCTDFVSDHLVFSKFGLHGGLEVAAFLNYVQLGRIRDMWEAFALKLCQCCIRANTPKSVQHEI